jgi:hypothetical protein
MNAGQFNREYVHNSACRLTDMETARLGSFSIKTSPMIIVHTQLHQNIEKQGKYLEK